MRVVESWRLKEQRYSLQGVRNEQTGEVSFPPRPVTPRKVETYDFHKDDAHEGEHQNGTTKVH